MRKIALFTAAAVSLTIFGTMSMTTEAANCNNNDKQFSNNRIVLTDANATDIQSVLNSLKEQQQKNCQAITIPGLPSTESSVENSKESAETEKPCVKIPETIKSANSNCNQSIGINKPCVKASESTQSPNSNCSQNTGTNKPCVKASEATQSSNSNCNQSTGTNKSCVIITKPSNNNCIQSTGTNKPNVETPAPQTPEVSRPETKVPEQSVPETKVPETKVPETKAPETKETEDKQQLTYAEQVVNLVNAERAKYGLNPLTIKKDVQAAAQVRTMEIQTSFSHTRPDGRSFVTALQEQSVSYRGAGENIAWGQRTPEQVMEAWMNSEGHRANILNAKYTSIGVGYYQNAKGVNYWTQLFTY